jgi:hypothetical protein
VYRYLHAELGTTSCLCPSVFLSVCVPVRLCSSPSVSLSVCVPIPVPVHVCSCSYPCPPLSLSLSAVVPVPILGSRSLSVCFPISLSVRLSPLFLSACVPAPRPVRQCPGPCPSVFLSTCVTINVRLCPCPIVSPSLSVCVLVHLCHSPCPFVSLSLSLSVLSFSLFVSVLCLYPWVNFYMLTYFQRASLATDNFQRHATTNFYHLFRSIQRTKSTEVTF